jgi:hypothetical protein
VLPNIRYMPAHLIQAMPVLMPALAALAWITWRWARLRRAEITARRDVAVALALAGSWLTVWGLYAAYTWTSGPGGTTLQVARFYVPALGAMSLLGARPGSSGGKRSATTSGSRSGSATSRRLSTTMAGRWWSHVGAAADARAAHCAVPRRDPDRPCRAGH